MADQASNKKSSSGSNEHSEDAPRLGPDCLVCGGMWSECPHDEFHVIASLRAALAKVEEALGEAIEIARSQGGPDDGQVARLNELAAEGK